MANCFLVFVFLLFLHYHEEDLIYNTFGHAGAQRQCSKGGNLGTA